MTDRATCWSLTINNPTDAEVNVELPAAWKLKGQFEEGEEGTRHFQGMLTTPQVRFSAVKKIFKRAHIEVARNKTALAQYVKKEDTRVGDFQDRQSDIPTLWDYSDSIASRIDLDVYRQALRELKETEQFDTKKHKEVLMSLVDEVVEADILAGKRGVEFIAINPMFRSAWSRFGVAMIKRAQMKSDPDDREDHEDLGIDRS